MGPLQIPNGLDSGMLDELPSWCNNAGRVDRSACLEIRASWVRELVGRPEGEVGSGVRAPGTGAEAPRGDAAVAAGRGMSLEALAARGWMEAENGMGRLRTAVVRIDVYDILAWEKRMAEEHTVGDRRGGRANCMREAREAGSGVRAPGTTSCGNDASVNGNDGEGSDTLPCPLPSREGEGLDSRLRGNDGGGWGDGPVKWRAEGMHEGQRTNPNRGVNRSKLLGLDERWSQWVRLEQWRLHPEQGVHTYLVCPGCGGFAELLEGLPAMSDAPRGLKARGCPQRVQMLYGVTCVEREWEQAQAWGDWLMRREMTIAEAPLAERVHGRYGLIMGRRVLRCRRCLGLRYGNNPALAGRWVKNKKMRDGLRQMWEGKTEAGCGPRAAGGEAEGEAISDMGYGISEGTCAIGNTHQTLPDRRSQIEDRR